MARKTISTDQAPKAIGPYSQAVSVDCTGLVFCSGQIPLDPATGKIIEGGVQEQTKRVMENLAAVLKEAGCGFADVVKTTIFLKSMDDFAAVNEVYGSYFTENPPARATVQVAKLPLDVAVEIDCIAAK